MENQLVRTINESGLDKTKAQVLLDNFSNYFEIASDWESKAKMLVITDITQRAEMKMAREGRLFLREKRIAVEKTRKSLKENALREGQTIDSIAKILTNLIVPIEEDLEQKEKYAEIKETERKAALKAAREMELQPYADFVPEGLDLGEMIEDNFNKHLASAKMQMKMQKEADAKAEAERIAKEQAEAAERERIRVENERLKAEAEAREKQAAADRAKAAAELKAEQDKAAADRLLLERKAAADRAEADRKLKAEQDKARLAADERAKLEAAIKAKAAAEAAAEQARLKAAQAALNAPDKEKLQQLAMQIADISYPDLQTKHATEILDNIKTLMSKVIAYINAKKDEL